MRENESRRFDGDGIIPPLGEKWFTEIDDDDGKEESAEYHEDIEEHRHKRRRSDKPVVQEEIYNDENDVRKEYEDIKQHTIDHEPLEEPEKTPEQPKKRQHIEYKSRTDNNGAGFTLRTSDDKDPKKVRSRQDELETAEDVSDIRESILQLRTSLTVRAAVLLFATVFSLFISIANDLEQPMAAVFDRTINPSAYIFTNTILGITAVGFSYSTIINGLKSLFRFSPDSDTLISLNLVSAIIAGLVTLFDPESLKMGYFHIYTSSAIMLLFLSTLIKLGTVRRTLRGFEFMTEDGGLAAVQRADEEELSELRTKKNMNIAYLRQTDFVRDMIKNSYSSDLSDLFAEKTVPLIFIAALAVGGMSWIFDKHAADTQEKVFVLLSAVSGTFSIASAASFLMISSSPLSAACKKLLRCGAVMLGYSSVEEHADVDTVVIDAAQLFTGGCVSIEETKMLSAGITEEEALLYAADLAAAGNSVTAGALTAMTGCAPKPVNGCITEASMGVIGWIDSKRMILGGRALLEKYNVIGLPTAPAESRFAKKNGVVYLAVSGKAVMMFSAAINIDRRRRRQIQALEDERVSINIRSCDSFIKQDDLAVLFDIKPETAAILPVSCEDEYDVMTEPADSLPASMFCERDAGAFAMLLIAAKRIRYAANIGVAVQYGAMILGIVISVILMFMNSFAQITPTVVLAYDIIFMLIMKFLQSFKKV